MKKFTAIIVMTAMLYSFTACGNDVADEVESSVTSVAEVSEEETTEEITESENETPENILDYKEALETLLDCMNNHDIESILKLSFPDKYIDVMNFMGEYSGYSIEEVMNYEDDGEETVRLAEIISEESVSGEDIETFHEYYGSFQLLSYYLDENGTDNFDMEVLWEWLDTLDTEDFPEPYFYTEDIHLVNCLLEYTDSDGDSYTEEQDFVVFYIDGEGWKIDMAMVDYTKKSKQQSLNSISASIMKASNVAIIELDEMDIISPEKCIICSDKSKNYNVTDDFVSQFEERLEHFFTDYNKFDYIIVINDDACVYTACADPEVPKYVGTYPANRIYSATDEYISKDSGITLDEIYNICLDEIQK